MSEKNCVSVDKDFRSAVGAVRRFVSKPSASAMFQVFDQLVDAPGLWRAAPGAALPAGPEQVLAKFEEPLAQLDDPAARVLNCLQAFSEGDGVVKLTVRILCAARALLVHNNPEVADKILLRLRSVEDADTTDAVTAFFLRVRCRINDERTGRLFNVLWQEKVGCRDEIAKEWIRLKWRYEGPDHKLLARALQLGLESQALKVAREALACAFRIEDKVAVRHLLEVFPKLVTSYDSVLPLAAHLVDHQRRTQAVDPEELESYAGLYSTIKGNSKELNRLLAARRGAIATVGNSPCELGQRRGGEIDEHDIVVRFNYFSVDPGFVADYGEKFDIHVRGPKNDSQLNHRTLLARYAVICQFDFLYQPRKWLPFLELSGQGAQLCCLPRGAHRPLQARLGVEPSLGIAFLAHLAAMRGGLCRESCYGFAFTDQVGENASSAHYFECARPALTHNWEGEARLFADLLVPVPGTLRS